VAFSFVFFLSQVPDIWSTSPPPYFEALHSSTSSTLAEDNEPVQQANASMVSDTRTEGKGENRVPDSCQLGRADNIRYTPHEARPTQHSETELYMWQQCQCRHMCKLYIGQCIKADLRNGLFLTVWWPVYCSKLCKPLLYTLSFLWFLLCPEDNVQWIPYIPVSSWRLLLKQIFAPDFKEITTAIMNFKPLRFVF